MLRRTLGGQGFLVEEARDVDEAKTALKDGFFHLLIQDIRMVDGDAGNVDGMDFLGELSKAGLHEAMAIVMLSGYGTRDQLRAAFRDHGVTDFQFKQDFDNQGFARRVKELFSNEAKINLQLEVHWQGVEDPEEPALNIKIGEDRAKRGTEMLGRVVAEVDDLLCRLFHEAKSITVKPMKKGHSGAGVLRVRPFYDSGAGQPVVVKFGDVAEIEQEARNYKRYVRNFLGGGRATNLEEKRRTAILGGIRYSLLGSSGEQFEDFGAFYQRVHLDEVKKVLDDLFQNTCGAWYANPGHLQSRNLTEEYRNLLGFTSENLNRALIHGLKRSVQGGRRLHFASLEGQDFLNPISILSSPDFRCTTYVCNTHGDLTESNILIDSSGACWLIDFLRTGPGHILRDFVFLDTAIRILLLDPAQASLTDRLEMEEALLDGDGIVEATLPTGNQALAKAYAASAHLRRLASRQTRRSPRDQTKEYLTASLFSALNLIRFYNLPSVQREHAMLAASLMAQRLNL